MEVRESMKKLIILIVCVASIILAICMTVCLNEKDEPQKTKLGERYDSEKVSMFSSGSIINGNYLDELNVLYERYREAASGTQFVVHEKTAIAIAEAVVKEIYPDEYYKVLDMSSYPKAVYYEAKNCWEVWLYTGVSRRSSMTVYIDIDSGAVKSIIPGTEY